MRRLGIVTEGNLFDSLIRSQYAWHWLGSTALSEIPFGKIRADLNLNTDDARTAEQSI